MSRRKQGYLGLAVQQIKRLVSEIRSVRYNERMKGVLKSQ